MTITRFIRLALAPALMLTIGTISGALAEDAEKPKPAPRTAREEIKAFCANIADSARDQRYLLQKEELVKLQAQVDDRIAQLDKRKSEYESWLKQRNDFLKKAEDDLVAIYKGMKPDAAAGQLNLIDPVLASAIIMKLSPRQSSQILAEMEPKKAAELTEIISAAGNRNTQGETDMIFKHAAPMMAVVLLAGCSGQAIKDLNRAPAMSPIGSGLNLTKTNALALYPKEPQQVATGYSLWSDQKSALFKDARALKIGDILTVKINIDDKATFDNTTDRKRETSWSRNFKLFGDDSTNQESLNANLGADSSSSSKGDGSIERKEQLNLQIAVVVTGVMDNGNLLISGSQEVRVNQELRVLNLAGIARPQDVDADNKIAYEKIAEARISYGGRGRLSEIQNPPISQQVVDVFSPF